jgi:DNA replication protein DnaC
MSAELKMATPEYDQLLLNLRQLRLSSITPVLETHLKRAAQTSMSYQDFLAGLVREALSAREQRSRERRLSMGRFPFLSRLEEFEWEAQPTFNRAEMQRLRSLQFIDAHDNVAFLGPPGLGKTMLAVSLGVAAVEAGYNVRFTRLEEWAADATAAELSGSLPGLINEWTRPHLVILDEVGHHPLNGSASRAFCHLLTRRYTHGSVVLTSNRGLDSWKDFLGDEVLAAAVLDRFLHHATVFSMSGESYRLKEAKRRQASGKL